nr:serine/threonine protein phosphatase 2A 55 kDa regulatory subunit B beta isoform-like isoform X3 [Tanacetum cinerariifolium]
MQHEPHDESFSRIYTSLKSIMESPSLKHLKGYPQRDSTFQFIFSSGKSSLGNALFSLCSAMCHETPVKSAGFQANISRLHLSCASGPKTIVHSSGIIMLLRRTEIMSYVINDALDKDEANDEIVERDQCFYINDMKPSNMDDLTEVITSAKFHPLHCSLLGYSSSRGFIKLADMRQSTLCDGSAIIEAWDIFKDLLRDCPHHGFSELHQLDTFYNALNSKNQDSLNSAVGVSDLHGCGVKVGVFIVVIAFKDHDLQKKPRKNVQRIDFYVFFGEKVGKNTAFWFLRFVSCDLVLRFGLAFCSRQVAFCLKTRFVLTQDMLRFVSRQAAFCLKTRCVLLHDSLRFALKHVAFCLKTLAFCIKSKTCVLSQDSCVLSQD